MKYCLYMHNGSSNYGCEALVRTTCGLLGSRNITLFSKNPTQDKEAGLSELCSLKKQGRRYQTGGFTHGCLKLSSAVFRHSLPYILYQYSDFIKQIPRYDVFLSIGGDNYCYPRYPDFMAYLNRNIKKEGKISVLWGCSIEPELLKQASVAEDLKRYDLITARERITYQALLDAGIDRNTHIYPDSAFTLQAGEPKVPIKLFEHKVVGINVSPLVQRKGISENIVFENYSSLIRYLLDHTDCNIALIPHVMIPGNDDREPMKELLHVFGQNRRIALLSGSNATETKGIIRKCDMFVGARTHAVIGAYSCCVPTLAVSYSVKAKGIAADIFGKWEPYVADASDFGNREDLTEAFRELYKNRDTIRPLLQRKIPDIIQNAKRASESIKMLTGETDEM